MLLQLQRYDVTIKYRPGKKMLLADALSRCPSQASGEIKLDMRVDYIAFSKAWIAKLKETTREGPILGTVYQLTQQGWPHQRRHTPRMARAYWDFRDQLSTDKGLLLMGPRIVILSCLCEEYLQRLHEGHLSATKVQQNARQHLYWPGLDADIADYTRMCQECIRRSQPPKEPFQAHDVPQEPWERIAMDYFYMNGRLYILICDYFSKFPFLFQVKTTSFANLKDHLEELFSVEGIPNEIMRDNGPPFNGKEFSSYLTGLGIRHTTSSPNYPQSNGFIETDPNREEAHGKGQHLGEESSRSPDWRESTATGRWTAIAGRDTSWEEPCYKKGKPSRFNCRSSVFNCIAGQVHQEP